MPPSVRNAIIALLVGWAAHYIFYFGFIAEDQPERVTYLQLGVGIGICYCVATIRKWARKLCIFFNIAMVATYLVFAIVFAYVDQVGRFALTAFIAAAFAFSLYSLLQKETAQFFSPPEKDKEQETDDAARQP
jgi:Ca2+/Na+ antiporter